MSSGSPCLTCYKPNWTHDGECLTSRATRANLYTDGGSLYPTTAPRQHLFRGFRLSKGRFCMFGRPPLVMSSMMRHALFVSASRAEGRKRHSRGGSERRGAFASRCAQTNAPRTAEEAGKYRGKKAPKYLLSAEDHLCYFQRCGAIKLWKVLPPAPRNCDLNTWNPDSRANDS